MVTMVQFGSIEGRAGVFSGKSCASASCRAARCKQQCTTACMFMLFRTVWSRALLLLLPLIRNAESRQLLEACLGGLALLVHGTLLAQALERRNDVLRQHLLGTVQVCLTNPEKHDIVRVTAIWVLASDEPRAQHHACCCGAQIYAAMMIHTLVALLQLRHVLESRATYKTLAQWPAGTAEVGPHRHTFSISSTLSCFLSSVRSAPSFFISYIRVPAASSSMPSVSAGFMFSTWHRADMSQAVCR